MVRRYKTGRTSIPNCWQPRRISTTRLVSVHLFECRSPPASAKILELALRPDTPDSAARGMPPNASTTDIRWVSCARLRRDGCSSARNWNRPTSADVASMVCSSDRYLANGIVAIARVSGWTKPRLKPAVFAPKPRLLRLRRAVGAVEAVGRRPPAHGRHQNSHVRVRFRRNGIS